MKRFSLPVITLIILLIPSSCELIRSIHSRIEYSAAMLLIDSKEGTTLELYWDHHLECPYTVAEYPEWLEPSPVNGSCKKGKEVIRLKPLISFRTATPDTLYGHLSIENCVTTDIIEIRMIIPDSTDFYLDESVYFDEINNIDSALIINRGNIPLSVNASSGSDLLAVEPAEFSLDLSDSAWIKVSLLNRDRPNGTYCDNIQLSVNQTITKIECCYSILHQDKFSINQLMVDADYSKSLKTVVLVPANVLTIKTYCPSTGELNQIRLGYTPTCISISADGKKAALGHDGYISLVDLEKPEIIGAYEIGFGVDDIELAENGTIFALARENPVEIYRVIISGSVAEKELLYEVSNEHLPKLRLRPDEKILYVITSEDKLSMIDLAGVEPEFKCTRLFSDLGQNLWFSEDGSLIYTEDRAIAYPPGSCSESISYDRMIDIKNSEGVVDPNLKIKHLFHSHKLDRKFILSNPSVVYEYYTYSRLSRHSYPVEPYLIISKDNTPVVRQAIPEYVFCNDENEELYVVTRIIPGAISHLSGIETIPLTD